MKIIKQIQYWGSSTMVVLMTSDGSGSVQLQKYPEYGYAMVSDLYVVAEKRGKGIGTALMFEVEKIARELLPDAYYIKLIAPLDSPKSLFTKLGYTFIYDVGTKQIRA